MMQGEPVEYIELDQERKWKYLRAYYEQASRFYETHDEVVSEAEVLSCVRAFKRVPAPKVRRPQVLKDWRWRLDARGEGLKAGWFSERCSERGWKELEVPHSMTHVPRKPSRWGRTRYGVLAPEEGMWWDIWRGDWWQWYRRRVEIGKLDQDHVGYLRFNSVNLVTDVWVNEHPVMMGHLGLFPFEVEVSEELGWGFGRESTIAVRVQNQATNTPFLFYNGWQIAYANPPYLDGTVKNHQWNDQSWGGMACEPELLILAPAHLKNAFLYTEEIVGEKARVVCRVEVRNAGWKRFGGTLRVEARKWHPEEGTETTTASAYAEVLPMSEATIEVRLEIPHASLWDVDRPNLYLAHVELADDSGRVVDDIYESFGVRTIRMSGPHFYLNGRKIVLRGTHDLSNYWNESLICPSDHAIVKDILLHKKMGANCSRWPSDIRMHYPRIAEYADQLGFMISWTGYFEMWTVHPEMEMYAKRDAPAMVRSLRNRPSIVVWEMGDEPLMDIHHQRRLQWYQAIHGLVKAEDSTRPIIPAGWWGNELVDLVCKGREKNGRDWPEARREVLREYPVFAMDLAPWDIHRCPYLEKPGPTPTWRVIDRVKDSLGGERATIFTEFGIDGMPEPEKVRHIYGKPRWSAVSYVPEDRDRKDSNYYGRKVGSEDWRETQAAQALVLSSIITRLRENPESFAGFYLVTLFDIWTFYWGVVDIAGNAKLAYFAAQACYGEMNISALHGSTTAKTGDALWLGISNFGAHVTGARLTVALKDEHGGTVRSRDFGNLEIPGDVQVCRAGLFDLAGVGPGLYGIESLLHDRGGASLCKRFELFYLE
jgi:hypothetical protein